MERQQKYSYDFPQAAVAVDCVIFAFDNVQLNLLLIERGIEPFKGMWALPGGFIRVGDNETAEDAAIRELREETGIVGVEVQQFHTFTAPFRDPRQRVISIAHYAIVRQELMTVPIGGDDAAQARWFHTRELPILAFDHLEIIQRALDKLRRRILFEPLSFQLLNEQFTMTELQNIYQIILGTTFDRRNFYKKMTSLGFLDKIESEEDSQKHKSAHLYTFNEARYSEAKKNRRNKLDFL